MYSLLSPSWLSMKFIQNNEFGSAKNFEMLSGHAGDFEKNSLSGSNIDMIFATAG
jgi:hypothetical protein